MAPRFWIANKTGKKLTLREPKNQNTKSLKPGDFASFYFQSKSKKLLSTLGKGFNWSWSHPFSVDELGTRFIKIQKLSGKNKGTHFVKVETRQDAGSLIVTFSEQKDLPPYLIKNLTSYCVSFWQKGPVIISVRFSFFKSSNHFFNTATSNDSNLTTWVDSKLRS